MVMMENNSQDPVSLVVAVKHSKSSCCQPVWMEAMGRQISRVYAVEKVDSGGAGTPQLFSAEFETPLA
jgi:hypothetical protein